MKLVVCCFKLVALCVQYHMTQKRPNCLVCFFFSFLRNFQSSLLASNINFFPLFIDMTFTNEGNKTHFDDLVNFEKMVSLYRFSVSGSVLKLFGCRFTQLKQKKK